MKRNWIEIITGAAVLVMAVLFFTYVIGLTGAKRGEDSYRLHASFLSVEGVNIGGEVRMAGIRIGSISHMELDDVSLMANLAVDIHSDVVIPVDSEVKIASEGLLGNNFVEIVPGGAEELMKEGDIFTHASGSVSFLELFLKFAAGDEE